MGHRDLLPNPAPSQVGHPFPVMTPPLTPPRHRWAIVIYSLASAVGQLFVYFTVTEFGPLLLTTV